MFLSTGHKDIKCKVDC